MIVWVFSVEIAGGIKLKLSCEFSEGNRVQGIYLEKMGKIVAMMQRFNGSNVISIQNLVLREISQTKLRKAGFMSRIRVNTCLMDALCKMQVADRAEGPSCGVNFPR